MCVRLCAWRSLHVNLRLLWPGLIQSELCEIRTLSLPALTSSISRSFLFSSSAALLFSSAPFPRAVPPRQLADDRLLRLQVSADSHVSARPHGGGALRQSGASHCVRGACFLPFLNSSIPCPFVILPCLDSRLLVCSARTNFPSFLPPARSLHPSAVPSLRPPAPLPDPQLLRQRGQRRRVPRVREGLSQAGPRGVLRQAQGEALALLHAARPARERHHLAAARAHRREPPRAGRLLHGALRGQDQDRHFAAGLGRGPQNGAQAQHPLPRVPGMPILRYANARTHPCAR